MKLPETITVLTPEVMDAYLDGRLNERQRHQVEKLLLEDDFASEAMDGLDLLSEEERHESFHRLEDALSYKVKRKKSNYPWLAVAAAVILLFLAGVWLFRIPGASPDTPEIAQVEKLKEAPVRAPSQLEATDGTTEIDEDTEEEMDGNSEGIGDILLSTKKSAVAKNEFQDTVGLVLGDVSPERLSQLDAVAIDSMGIEEAMPTAASEMEEPAAMTHRIAGEQIPKEVSSLTGTIILEDGMPLTNVNVRIEGTDNADFSDEKGKFDISAESDATLVFSLRGLEPREVTMEELSANSSVVMRQQSATLSELEISTPDNEAYTSQGASPDMDLDAYEAYLADNMVYPEVDEPQSGEVVIRVTIEPDGTISNTKILRSLGEPYDIEAIRLIREGPAWRPAVKNGTPVRDKVRVKVSFDGK